MGTGLIKDTFLTQMKVAYEVDSITDPAAKASMETHIMSVVEAIDAYIRTANVTGNGTIAGVADPVSHVVTGTASIANGDLI